MSLGALRRGLHSSLSHIDLELSRPPSVLPCRRGARLKPGVTALSHLHIEMLPTPERTAGEHLVRGIRKWDFVALVLNSIVGAGIFGLPSRAYALAGVHSLLAYVVCAVPVFLIILCFAEVSSRFKDTGGPYLYARATFGPLVGFEIGWLSWIVRLTAFAALCNLFVDYLGYFLPTFGSGLGRAVVMTVVVSFLTGANLAGVRLASLVGNIFTVGKLVPLVLLVVVGFFFINPESYSAAPPSYRAFSASVLLLVFAFTGFEMAVIPAGEARDPQRHLPFALLTGTAIVVVLYVSIQAVCIGTLPELASSQRPLADVGGRLFGMAGSCSHFAGRADLCDGNDECHHACRTAAAVCHGRAGAAASDRFSHTRALPHAPRSHSALRLSACSYWRSRERSHPRPP